MKVQLDKQKLLQTAVVSGPDALKASFCMDLVAAMAYSDIPMYRVERLSAFLRKWYDTSFQCDISFQTPSLSQVPCWRAHPAYDYVTQGGLGSTERRLWTPPSPPLRNGPGRNAQGLPDPPPPLLPTHWDEDLKT